MTLILYSLWTIFFILDLPFSQSSRKEERIAIKNIACHVIHQRVRVLKLSSLNEAITPGPRGRGDNEIFSSHN